MNIRTNIPVEKDGRFLDAGKAGHLAGGAPRTATVLVQLAVDAIDQTILKPPSPDAISPCSQARAVLGLLVNCYLHQIYSSRKAAELAAHDPEFPWFWWEDYPDAPVVRRFREENSVMIHQCLTNALHLMAEEQNKFAGTINKINGQHAREASRRITMASYVDSMELDWE